MIRYKIKRVKGESWANSKSCLVGISVGADYHEGEKFSATMKWISKNFSKVHIYIGDTLHRHNMIFEYCETPEQATVRSRLAGDDWIVRNSEMLQGLPIPWSLSRWDDWLQDSRFTPSREQLEVLYQNSEEFRAAATTDADRYVANTVKRGIQIYDRDFAIRKSIELILEENAVFPLVIEDFGGIDIYPGSELQSTKIIRDLPILGAPSKLYEKKFARIGFKRLGSMNDDELVDMATTSEASNS